MTRRSAKKPSARRPAVKAGLSAYRIGGEAPRGALRLGTVRHLPRGVRREDRDAYFDVWLPLLAPSRELLRWWLAGEPSDERFRVFTRRYRREMAGSAQRGAVALLAAVSRRTPLALGCYCDSRKCHRFLLEGLIREAASHPG